MNQLEEKHQFMRFAICLLMVVFVVCPGMATETENLNIRILPVPGQVKIDGQTGDWDLSGGVFVCGDVENLRDQLSVWVHAMYDAENLYVLGRYRDETPLSNPGLAGADQPWTGDSLQLRIIADLQWKASNGKPAICWVNNWRDREGKDAIDIDFPWKTNAGEILKDALAKGARQALSLPKTPPILSCTTYVIWENRGLTSA